MTPTEASDSENDDVQQAIAYLAACGVPATAREFRLRQEFFRHGWDIRVRETSDSWTVQGVKPGLPDILIEASSEGNVLRIALMNALQSDVPDSAS